MLTQSPPVRNERRPRRRHGAGEGLIPGRLKSRLNGDGSPGEREPKSVQDRCFQKPTGTLRGRPRHDLKEKRSLREAQDDFSIPCFRLMGVPPPMLRSERCAHMMPRPLQTSSPGPIALQPLRSHGHRGPCPASLRPTVSTVCLQSERRVEPDSTPPAFIRVKRQPRPLRGATRYGPAQREPPCVSRSLTSSAGERHPQREQVAGHQMGASRPPSTTLRGVAGTPGNELLLASPYWLSFRRKWPTGPGVPRCGGWAHRSPLNGFRGSCPASWSGDHPSQAGCSCSTAPPIPPAW